MSGTRARLFFGASLPDASARALHAALASDFEAAGWRLSDPRDLHVTLLFLGSVPVERIAELADLARGALAGARALEVRLETLGAFPSIDAPRVAWAGGAALSAATFDLHRGLHAAALGLGLARAPRSTVESWTAHVTFARPAKGRRGRWPRDLRFVPLAPFRVEEIALFESSTDGAQGSRYRALERIPLSRPPG